MRLNSIDRELAVELGLADAYIKSLISGLRRLDQWPRGDTMGGKRRAKLLKKAESWLKKQNQSLT